MLSTQTAAALAARATAGSTSAPQWRVRVLRPFLVHGKAVEVDSICSFDRVFAGSMVSAGKAVRLPDVEPPAPPAPAAKSATKKD